MNGIPRGASASSAYDGLFGHVYSSDQKQPPHMTSAGGARFLVQIEAIDQQGQVNGSDPCSSSRLGGARKDMF